MKRACVECSAELPEGSKFCPGCGTRINHLLDTDVLNFGMCPDCGRYQLRVTSTRRPYRYVLCKSCGATRQTAEIILGDSAALQLAYQILSDHKIRF